MTGNSISVLVVGAGPTGLTAALELARRGIAVRIIERKAEPTPLSKAVGVSPHSLDLLEPSGVTPLLLETGIKVPGADFYFEGRKLGTFDLTQVKHRFNFLLSLPQSETETIMARRLAAHGVDIEWETEFVQLSRPDEAVSATIRKAGRRRTAKFTHLFAGDGVHSAVREALGLEFKGRTHDRRWSIADADIADWPYRQSAAHAFLHRNGDVGFIIPIGRRRFRAVSNTPDALAHVPGDYRIVELLRTDTFDIHVRQADTFQSGRVFLGGDAAHVHSPVGARGMNLGIEDAEAFARRLAAGELDGYTDERWPVGHDWIELSERVLAAAQSSGAIAQTARNLLLYTVGHFPRLQRPILNRLAGLAE